MNIRLTTNYQKMMLVVPVQTQMPCKIRIRVYDEENPLTVLTNRYMTVSGKQDFVVRLPLTGKSVVINIFNEKNGDRRKGEDPTFSVGNIEVKGLQKKFDVRDLDPTVSSFIDFAQRFSFNASYLDAGQTYVSDDENFEINYQEVLISKRTNRATTTPARIAESTGIISVAKKYFGKYTVPMRVAILCHEFSHKYLNTNPKDETEADINGLTIYLGLGYPRIEALEAFISVFENADNAANRKRHKIIEDFVMNFENYKIVTK